MYVLLFLASLIFHVVFYQTQHCVGSCILFCMKITFLEHPVRISKMEMVFFVIVPNLMDHFHHMPQWEEETPKIVPFFITITPACWLRLLCDFRLDVINQSFKICFIALIYHVVIIIAASFT